MPLPAAWLSPPAAPWQLDAEPSSADHPVSCLEGATPGALSPCGCQAEGGLQTSFQSLEPCPYQEAWEAWASEAWGASPAPRQEMQWGEENWQFSLCHFNQPPLYKTYLLHLSTYKQINEGWIMFVQVFFIYLGAHWIIFSWFADQDASLQSSQSQGFYAIFDKQCKTGRWSTLKGLFTCIM